MMKIYILFFALHLYCLPIFSQVLQKEMLVFRFLQIRSQNNTGENQNIYFYLSEGVVIEYSPHFKWKRDLYKLCGKGLYGFFNVPDSINVEYNINELSSMLNTLSQSSINAYHGSLENIHLFQGNKYLENVILGNEYSILPNNLYVEVFQAKISYVYVGKTECLLPNFKYNKRTRKKEPLMIPLVCNAYEIVGVEYFKPYKLKRKRICLK